MDFVKLTVDVSGECFIIVLVCWCNVNFGATAEGMHNEV